MACNPKYAGVKGVRFDLLTSSTDNQPPPRKEREAVANPSYRQIRDGAGAGGRAREQLDT